MFACIYIPNASAETNAVLRDCASTFSPRVENTSNGTVVFDAEGLERLFGSYPQIAEQVAEQVRSRGIEANVAVAANVDAAICALRERLFDGLLHSLRPQRKHNHFATMFLFEPQCLFQSVAVRLIHFETDIRFPDPVPGNRQRRIFCRHLLDANDNVHASFLYPENLRRGCPKDFDLAAEERCRSKFETLLTRPALEDQSGVRPTKSERI